MLGSYFLNVYGIYTENLIIRGDTSIDWVHFMPELPFEDATVTINYQNLL